MIAIAPLFDSFSFVLHKIGKGVPPKGKAGTGKTLCRTERRAPRSPRRENPGNRRVNLNCPHGRLTAEILIHRSRTDQHGPPGYACISQKKPPTPQRHRRFRKGGGGEKSGDFRDFEHLATAVSSAGRAGDVRWDGSAAIRAGFQAGCLPAFGHCADFLLAAGGASFRYGHGMSSAG